MIQRIQSVWLLLAGVVIFALFMFPYLQYIDVVGLGKAVKISGVYGVGPDGQPLKETSFILQLIATVLLGLLPIFTIFQYKSRKTQKQLIFLNMVLIVLFAGWMYATASSTLASVNQYLGASNIGVGFFLLPIAIIFLSMALGAIRKDDLLIKSADRLR